MQFELLENNQYLITLWCAPEFLRNNFKRVEISIINLHVSLFDNDDNLSYLNNSNIGKDISKNCSISDLLDIVENSSQEYLINKLEFTYKNQHILYDDDALLLIRGSLLINKV